MIQREIVVKTSNGKVIRNIANNFKYVHIGDDIWGCGTVNPNYQGMQERHMVIYGPNRIQHHIFNKDVDFVTTASRIDYNGDYYMGDGYCNRHGNYAVESRLKIFILTSILDNPLNWCYDLKKLPKSGKLKVIYENGTVKNIDFNGVFEAAIIPYSWSRDKTSTRPVPAFGYRKFNHPIQQKEYAK